MNKKLLSILIAATTCSLCIGSVLMNANANDEVTKNYSYFNSLSDSELAEEYYEYCQEIGKDITKRSVENGVIKNDLIKNISKQVSWSTLNGCSLDIIASYKWQKENNISGSGTFKNSRSEEDITKLRTWSIDTKEDGTIEFIPFYGLDYYGFDDLSSGWDTMFFDIDQQYISFVNSKLANNTAFSPVQEAEIKAHNYLCCLLTVFNSDFYNEYCRNCEGDVLEYNIEIMHHHTSGGSTFQKGDANSDGEVGLADALTILQFIANSQKYPMYEEGYEVADIVGDDDGVTPLDALEIQKWDSQKKLS